MGDLPRRQKSKQVAVDVGESSKVFIEVYLALFVWRVQNIEEPSKVQSKVRAVFSRVVQQVELERFTFEDACVFGEEAKEDANKEAFESMACVPACLKCVMQATYDLDCFNVDRVLRLELVLLITRYEREVMDVGVEIS